MSDPYLDDGLPSVPSPLCWRPAPEVGEPTWEVLDETEREARLSELHDWVRWLSSHYDLDRTLIPPCWAEHPPLVEELTALWGAWQVAYYPAGSAAGPLDWHSAFAHARLRLRDWTSRTGCTSGDHQAQGQDYDESGISETPARSSA